MCNVIAGYGELVAALQRLQLQLKKAGHGYSALEAQAAAVQTLLLSPSFGRALAAHNKVQQSWSSPKPVSGQAQALARDVSTN